MQNADIFAYPVFEGPNSDDARRSAAAGNSDKQRQQSLSVAVYLFQGFLQVLSGSERPGVVTASTFSVFHSSFK